MSRSSSAPADARFKRPYASRRQRTASRPEAESPANGFLLKVLVGLVVVFLVSLAVIFGAEQGEVSAGTQLFSGQ